MTQAVRAIIICKPFLMQAVTVDEPVHERIAGDPKYQPYFGNCFGAFDGTHNHAVVSSLEAALFRNRKQFISQFEPFLITLFIATISKLIIVTDRRRRFNSRHSLARVKH